MWYSKSSLFYIIWNVDRDSLVVVKWVFWLTGAMMAHLWDLRNLPVRCFQIKDFGKAVSLVMDVLSAS